MKLSKYFVLSLFLSPLLITLTSAPAHAYLTIGESGEVIAPGKYQVGTELQLLTNKNTGGNFNVFLDSSINDATSARITMGAGAVDFNAFASAKWIPFPDVGNQPAMGLRAGAGIARDEDENIIQFQFAPLASKKVDTEYGLTIPYIAVPFTYLNMKSENVMASNIAFGTEFRYVEWKQVTMGAELGIELNKSYSYVSIFASIPFDGQTGFGN